MATYYVKSGVATIWAATTAYALGARVAPTLAYGTTAAKGRVYECTTAGTSGGTEPTWNTTVGGTTTDGGVTWTTRDITTWTNACPYLHYAVNYRNNNSPAGGDTLYVSNNHAEVVAQTDNFNSTGSTIPVNILCVNDTAIPPTTITTGATVTITSSSSITFLGWFYSEGISYTVGSGQTGFVSLSLGSTSGTKQYFKNGLFSIASSGSFCPLFIGSTTAAPREIILDNMKLSFNNSSQHIYAGSSFTWRNTPSAISGVTIPSTLFYPVGEGTYIFDSVDLSAQTGSITDPQQGPGTLYMQNCKVNANILTNFNSTSVSQQGYSASYLHNCDSGSTTYKLFELNYYGTTRTETTLVRTGGASDGTTTISWKMISASITAFYAGLVSPWISQWQNTTGTSKTATVEFLHDSLTALTNADIYAEVEYFATTNPGTSFANNRATDILATPSAHGSSTATWTTTGMTNPNKQKLVVNFTPGMVGPVRVKIYLLKPSYTVYIDPLVTIA